LRRGEDKMGNIEGSFFEGDVEYMPKVLAVDYYKNGDVAVYEIDEKRLIARASLISADRDRPIKREMGLIWSLGVEDVFEDNSFVLLAMKCHLNLGGENIL
jgi:hypothetical protein